MCKSPKICIPTFLCSASIAKKHKAGRWMLFCLLAQLHVRQQQKSKGVFSGVFHLLVDHDTVLKMNGKMQVTRWPRSTQTSCNNVGFLLSSNFYMCKIQWVSFKHTVCTRVERHHFPVSRCSPGLGGH